ncbi:MAG: PAS domain S-box protein, partial [Chloroflexi bacterium]|nr:PAS domain S-box protein [Chloroflexota bacterium]
MTYETFLSCVHPEDREYVDSQWQAALQGEDYDIEHRIIVGNEIKWVREKAELEFDEQGMLQGGFGTVQDITEKVLAAETIKQAARQWQETFDAIPDLISIHDRDYSIIKVNRAFARALGTTTEELIGKKCYEVFHKSHQPIPGCPHQQTMQTGRLTREEIFEPSRNAYFDIFTVPIVNAGGEITSSVHHARDITELKRSEEQMAFQAHLLDAIEDVVVTTDIEGQIIFWGRGAANLLGWRAEEVVGRRAEDFLVPEELGQQAQAIRELLRSGQRWAGEFTARCKDGTLTPFLVRSSPVLDADGKVMGIIAVGKDITELKKAEQIKDEFIGLVSHELRTPLTVIGGSLRSAMSAGISPEDAQELLQNAVEGADSLTAILENMLELSRHQAGRLQLRLEVVSIPDVTPGVIDRLKGQGACQRFLIDFAGDLPAVEADPMRVERILHNLLENATKYSPPESEIKVSGQVAGNFIITEVADQGKGISADDQKKLFELFQQLETVTRPTRGLGLGLVVCKRLVEAQGGWIKVDSAVGQGSTFSFALPIRRTKV